MQLLVILTPIEGADLSKVRSRAGKAVTKATFSQLSGVKTQSELELKLHELLTGSGLDPAKKSVVFIEVGDGVGLQGSVVMIWGGKAFVGRNPTEVFFFGETVSEEAAGLFPCTVTKLSSEMAGLASFITASYIADRC